MDEYDLAQAVLEEVDKGPGKRMNSKGISSRLSEVTGSEVTMPEVYDAAELLEVMKLVTGSFLTGDEALNLNMTPKGRSVILRGQSIKDCLMESSSPQASTVSYANTVHGNVGQFANENRGTMNQTNNLYNSEDMSRVLNIMREHGHTQDAAEVEILDQQQDQKGAIRKLLERLGEKSLDKTVDGAYAVAILPALTQLISATALV